MTTVEPARREADLLETRAHEYQQQALAELAGHPDLARTEVTPRLRAMQPWGWTLLTDRDWGPRAAAGTGMVLIGPGGVLVIDVRCDSEPRIDGAAQLTELDRCTELVIDATSELGLSPLEVVPVLVLVTGRAGAATAPGRVTILDERGIVPWAHARGPRLTGAQVAALTARIEQRLPPRPGPSPVRAEADHVSRPARHAAREQAALFDADELAAAILQHAAREPVEDWMVFLHPEQVPLVRRTGTGPSRIRGAAGTGKTVLALHRAAYLAAHSSGPLLVTSVSHTLPRVLTGLYGRLAPSTAERVEFASLGVWAAEFLEGRGHRPSVDPHFADVAFGRAWSRTGRRSGLAGLGAPPAYWQDEIHYVVKGRGISSFRDYAALQRIGRRTALGPKHREAVWQLYLDYQDRLREFDVIDANDLLGLALTELRERPLATPYRAVIADEVQDLNCLGVRLLAELSGGGQDLLLVGDGQQQICPGGFTLAEAGIWLGGRSTLLRTNHRNSANILSAAEQVVAHDEFDDLEGESEQAHRDISITRSGGQVWDVPTPSPGHLRRSAVEHVRRLLDSGHDAVDVALLCATNSEVEAYLLMLAAAEVPAIRLTEYAGLPVDAVKVGTVQRAKGLEFRHVVRPIQPGPMIARASAETQQEFRERSNRELFVAMTRARDTVWVGRVA